MVYNDWPMAAHGWACAVDGYTTSTDALQASSAPGRSRANKLEGHTGSQGLHALASPALTEEVVGAVLTAKVEAIHDEYRRDSLDHLDLPVLRRHRHEVTADVSSDVS